MNQELALKLFDAILLSSRRKIKKHILAKFFSGFDLKELIQLAQKRYENLGFFIYEDEESVELVTRPLLAKYLVNFFGFEENEVFQDFLEVLAIIAYGGPISLAKIDRLRGKKSLSILNELITEGLIEKEKKFYRISSKFLKTLGFQSEKELPDYLKLRREIRGEK